MERNRAKNTIPKLDDSMMIRQDHTDLKMDLTNCAFVGQSGPIVYEKKIKESNAEKR